MVYAQPYSVSIDSPHRFRLQIFQTLQNNRMEEAFGASVSLLMPGMDNTRHFYSITAVAGTV